MKTKLTEDIEDYRSNWYDSDPIFVNRWSPRAMTGESVSDNDLMAMLEAAHWAPSSFNNQPWRFIYARRKDREWEIFFNLLTAGNKSWCRNASILVVIVSKSTFDRNGKPSRTSAYDTGAAWGMFALEGASRGLVVHGIQGFDYDRARKELKIPDGFEIQAMASVGIYGNAELLEEKNRSREKPSLRKDFSRIVARGKFTTDLL